ncbi:hypothetical protein ABZ883_14825 [Streptomyces sp. NPDC046977]|uniref:hypothetical protein n=1 Tax=Streptomyces sp. NPDC046977 TaxID=3154703 RepID=UPI00340097CB
MSSPAPFTTVHQVAHGAGILLRQAGPALRAGEWRETAARWVVAIIVGSLLISAVYQYPLAWWVLAAAFVLAARAAGKPEETEEEQEETLAEVEPLTPEGVLEVVWDVVGDQRGALLTLLAAELGAADTKAARELLAEAGIPVRAGVRTPAGNGPGVHRLDLPSPDSGRAPVGVVAAGEAPNANANNTSVEEVADGVRIVKHGPSRRQEAVR